MALGDNDNGKGSVESGVAGMGKDFLTFRGKGHCWGTGWRNGGNETGVDTGRRWGGVASSFSFGSGGGLWGALWGKELLFLVTDDVLQVT